MKPLLPMFWWQTGAGLTAGLGLLALAGCTVGPDFHPPEVKSPAVWVNTDQPNDTAVTSHLVPNPVITVDWWTTFGDPELTKLVRDAAAQNLTVLQAEARIRASQAGVGVATSALVPSVSATASDTDSSAHQSAGRWSMKSGLAAAWELDIFGSTRRSMEASRASFMIASSDAAFSRRDKWLWSSCAAGAPSVRLAQSRNLCATASSVT